MTKKAFDAVELRRFTNDDGSIHVAEFSINGQLFRLHKEKESANQFSPEKINGTATLTGLFLSDVDAVMNNALAAGATLLSRHRIMTTDTGKQVVLCKTSKGGKRS